MKTFQDHLNAHQSRYIAELAEFVAIPSVSAAPRHASDVRRAADWVAARLTVAGADNARVINTDMHPVAYGDWLHAGADKPTVLIYGHFDVQPAEPFDLWDTPPFEPAIRDGKMFGRGASDDKGGMFGPILAIEALLATNGALPVNVKFLFEGEEEIGSPSLPAFVAANHALLESDMIFSADGLQWDENTANLVVGLKGLVSLEISVSGPATDQHSGLHGGAMANPLMALSQIVASLKGPDGRILVDGFYDAVEDLTADERADIARIPFDAESYREELGVPELHNEAGYSTREALWARPTLDMNGVWGGYQGAGSKTVHPSEAFAKITCRLVSGQRPDEIFDKIARHVTANTPIGVRAAVTRLPGSADPFTVPRGHNAGRVAQEVLAEVYDKEPHITRLGGSIPVMSIFQQELGQHATMFGFSLPDDNLHAPNESFRLSSFARGQTAYCKLLERLGTQSGL